MCINVCWDIWELQKRQSWCWGTHLVQFSLQTETRAELQSFVNKGHKVTSSRWVEPESHSRSRRLRRECGTAVGRLWGSDLFLTFFTRSLMELRQLALRGDGVSVSEGIKSLAGPGPEQPALVHTAQARTLEEATCRGLFQTQLFCDFVNIKGSIFASERAVFKHFPTNKSLNQRKWTIILL